MIMREIRTRRRTDSHRSHRQASLRISKIYNEVLLRIFFERMTLTDAFNERFYRMVLMDTFDGDF